MELKLSHLVMIILFIFLAKIPLHDWQRPNPLTNEDIGQIRP